MEIQDYEPPVRIPVEKIGFKNIRRRVTLRTPKGEVTLDLILDVTVSIDGDRRGAHLSRNIEALSVPDLLSSAEGKSIEEYLESVADRLLDLHDYALQVEARARTTYYIEISFHELRGLEPVDVDVVVAKGRDGSRVWTAAVTLSGMSVCPSAQSTIASLLGSVSVAPSHVQRVLVTGRVSTRGEMVRIEKIAGAIAASFSAPSFTMLKRDQEGKLVLEAHRNPKFAEDIAREAICKIASALASSVSGDPIIEVEVESLESIHPHNVYAYTRGRLMELTGAMGSCNRYSSSETST